MPRVWELARRTEEHMKGMIVPGTMFEELGFNYIGPIDGHDLDVLVPTLEKSERYERPALFAYRHQKRQRLPARRSRSDQVAWPRPFDPKSGFIYQEKASGPTYTAGVRQLVVRYGAGRTNAWWALPRPCAKAPDW